MILIYHQLNDRIADFCREYPKRSTELFVRISEISLYLQIDTAYKPDKCYNVIT
jgi:hypothetical protein